MSKTTAQELLNDDPTNDQLERVDALWGSFNSTTQLLVALKQVLHNREALDYERQALEKFLPVFAQVEANSMNVPLADLPRHPEPEPITQRY